MKTPLIKLEFGHTKCLLICGEDLFFIREILNELKIEIKKQYHEREFHVFDTTDFLILATGIGSASVEIATNELSMIEIEEIYLAGTCGSTKKVEIGKAVFIKEAKFIQGSPLYYKEITKKTFFPLINSDEQSVTCSSSDSFYNSDNDADVVDMEAGYVYAFQKSFNFKACAIKGISNIIGQPINDESAKLALKNSIQKCINSLLSN